MNKELKALEHMIFNVPLDKQNIEELRVKYLILKQHITNQEEEIEKLSYTNQVKTIVELTVENSIIQSKLDKIQKIINHADEVGLDLVYYKDIKKVLEEK